MRAQLPKDFDPLLDAALREAPPPFESAATVRYDDLVDRVAQRLGADGARARVALDAVLEALARRITSGQLDDLEAVLPGELRPALERGRARSGERAVPRYISRTGSMSRVARPRRVRATCGRAWNGGAGGL
jgi:uncharacterized protein (DUF2267 family)